MTKEGPPRPAGASRRFYEELAGRSLPESTVRGIVYRNHVVAGRLAGAGLSVLEVGPGEGWLTRLLVERGHRVVTADIARTWLARSGTADLEKVVGGMTALPFAGAAFDAVVAAEVVEHIPDLDRALAEAARVLKPGGRLVLTVPFRETLTYVHCPDCGARFEKNGHVRSFDGDDLADALRSAGLLPERRFVGSTRFARELLRRLPVPGCLPLITTVDRATGRGQRVSDTWLLMAARKPGA